MGLDFHDHHNDEGEGEFDREIAKRGGWKGREVDNNRIREENTMQGPMDNDHDSLVRESYHIPAKTQQALGQSGGIVSTKGQSNV